MKQVYIAENLTEAHLIKGLLEAEGILSVVQGEYLSWVRGGAPMMPDTCPSVWVFNKSHFGRAKKLVSAFYSGENSKEATRKAWRCAKCGELIEGQFNQCWQCGTDSQ